jgi:hypothetical protein
MRRLSSTYPWYPRGDLDAGEPVCTSTGKKLVILTKFPFTLTALPRVGGDRDVADELLLLVLEESTILGDRILG